MQPDIDSEDLRHEPNWEFNEPIDAIILRKENIEIIRKAIDRQPQDYRLVLLLRDVEGYSTEEVADILGIYISASKTRLHRARLALKKTNRAFNES